MDSFLPETKVAQIKNAACMEFEVPLMDLISDRRGGGSARAELFGDFAPDDRLGGQSNG